METINIWMKVFHNEIIVHSHTVLWIEFAFVPFNSYNKYSFEQNKELVRIHAYLVIIIDITPLSRTTRVYLAHVSSANILLYFQFSWRINEVCWEQGTEVEQTPNAEIGFWLELIFFPMQKIKTFKCIEIRLLIYVPWD